MVSNNINPYLKYFINKNTFVLIFSAILTGSIILLCIIKAYNMSSKDPQFTIYFTMLFSLINLWIPIQLKHPKDNTIEGMNDLSDTQENAQINKYIKYFINKYTFLLTYSAILSLSGILFCMRKIYYIKSDDPLFTMYFSTMMSLITIWIPIQFLKSKK